MVRALTRLHCGREFELRDLDHDGGHSGLAAFGVNLAAREVSALTGSESYSASIRSRDPALAIHN